MTSRATDFASHSRVKDITIPAEVPRFQLHRIGWKMKNAEECTKTLSGLGVRCTCSLTHTRRKFINFICATCGTFSLHSLLSFILFAVHMAHSHLILLSFGKIAPPRAAIVSQVLACGRLFVAEWKTKWLWAWHRVVKINCHTSYESLAHWISAVAHSCQLCLEFRRRQPIIRLIQKRSSQSSTAETKYLYLFSK